MAKKSSTNKREVPFVLAAHIRWALVLRALLALREGAARNDLDKLVQTLGAAELFGESPSGRLCLDRARWERRFTEGRKARRSGGQAATGHDSDWSRAASVYDCRAFYGLDAANNLATRLARMASQASVAERLRESRFDARIAEWGDYAVSLVRRNGGWPAFMSKRSLAEILDARPDGMGGDDARSLIQRILAAYESRYFQVLLSPVSLLWPLWMLNNPDHREIFGAIPTGASGATRTGSQSTSTAPPDYGPDALFLDISTRRDDRQSLPYPFGFASGVLGSEHDNGPWSPCSIQEVATKLKDEPHGPPLIFALREDQWEAEESSLREPTHGAARLILLAQRSETFATFFRKHDTKDVQSIAIEHASWADAAVPHSAKITRLTLTRRDMVTAHERNVDLILSHFPADLLLRGEDTYKPEDVWTVGGSLSEADERLKHALHYITPGVALWGSKNMLTQAPIYKAVITLGRRLRDVERAVKLLTAGLPPIATRASDQVQEVRKHLETNERKFLPQRPPALDRPSLIESLFKQIGRDMTESLFDQENTDIANRFRNGFDEWGWVVLLDYVRFARIDYSDDFVHRGNTE